jgi:hypothetical protein
MIRVLAATDKFDTAIALIERVLPFYGLKSGVVRAHNAHDLNTLRQT